MSSGFGLREFFSELIDAPTFRDMHACLPGAVSAMSVLFPLRCLGMVQKRLSRGQATLTDIRKRVADIAHLAEPFPSEHALVGEIRDLVDRSALTAPLGEVQLLGALSLRSVNDLERVQTSMYADTWDRIDPWEECVVFEYRVQSHAIRTTSHATPRGIHVTNTWEEDVGRVASVVVSDVPMAEESSEETEEHAMLDSAKTSCPSIVRRFQTKQAITSSWHTRELASKVASDNATTLLRSLGNRGLERDIVDELVQIAEGRDLVGESTASFLESIVAPPDNGHAPLLSGTIRARCVREVPFDVPEHVNPERVTIRRHKTFLRQGVAESRFAVDWSFTLVCEWEATSFTQAERKSWSALPDRIAIEVKPSFVKSTLMIMHPRFGESALAIPLCYGMLTMARATLKRPPAAPLTLRPHSTFDEALRMTRFLRPGVYWPSEIFSIAERVINLFEAGETHSSAEEQPKAEPETRPKAETTSAAPAQPHLHTMRAMLRRSWGPAFRAKAHAQTTLACRIVSETTLNRIAWV